MLTRTEIEERLRKYQSIEGMAIVISAGMYREALETAQALYKQIEVSQDLIDKLFGDIAELSMQLEFRQRAEEVIQQYQSALEKLSDA